MADRSFHPWKGGLEIDPVVLWGTITIGATGAVSSSSGKGIASVVRDSAGKYTITLSDRYNAFLWGSANVLNSTLSDPTTVGIYANLFSEAVNNATPTVVIQFVALDDGAAADPANGAVVYFKLEMRNSSVS